MDNIVCVNDVTMEYDLNRGKVRSLKEKMYKTLHPNADEKKMFRALNNVSFSVKKGEIFGIIGNNGAGKSTMLKLLAGIMHPTSGSISVSGTIAPMIELGTGFDFELSPEENIQLSGSILGYDSRFLKEKVPDIFDFSELWEFKDVPVKYFSSGMVARLAFAISTIVIPDVLIVDEILSVGDMAFQRKSYKRMLELMEGGTTVVYVSHDIDSIKKLCNRVMWLEKGNVKCIGEAGEITDMFVKSLS